MPSGTRTDPETAHSKDAYPTTSGGRVYLFSPSGPIPPAFATPFPSPSAAWVFRCPPRTPPPPLEPGPPWGLAGGCGMPSASSPYAAGCTAIRKTPIGRPRITDPQRPLLHPSPVPHDFPPCLFYPALLQKWFLPLCAQAAVVEE